MLSRKKPGEDSGQLTLLIIGFTTLAAALIVVGVDASKVFLARRALSSAADAAALAGAQSIDRASIYSGHDGEGCGGLLPIDPTTAASRADATLADDVPDLLHTFARVDAPETSVAAGTVTVRLGGDVALPFGSMLSMLHLGTGGTVHVDVRSAASSPQRDPNGC